MTIFTHKVPANLVGISVPAVPAVVNGGYAVQDVERAIYAMQSSLPVKVGWQAATSDGQGGIKQLARGLDATYNWQSSTTGFGITGNTSGVTVQFPSLQVLWNGSMQPVNASSWTGTPPGAGSFSFCVSYAWGLNSFSIGTQGTLNNVVELCEFTVSAATATLQAANSNGNWMGQYYISNIQTNSGSNIIPYSDANGNTAF
jgi:hypothetical protein